MDLIVELLVELMVELMVQLMVQLMVDAYKLMVTGESVFNSWLMVELMS